MPIHDLRDMNDLLANLLAYDFLAQQSIVLVAKFQQLDAHVPHLPRNALRWEKPVRFTFLEELQRYLTAALVVAAQAVRKLGDLLLQNTIQGIRRAAYVRDVDEVAVHILVADAAHRVRAILLEGKLAEGAMEENRVEEAGDCFVYLSALDFQFKGLRSAVHFDGDGKRRR